MTKDRRLGRGLAALLGTPLEEDGIIEGATATHGEQSRTRATTFDASPNNSLTSSRSSSGSTTGTSANHSSALVRGATVKPVATTDGDDLSSGTRRISQGTENTLKVHTPNDAARSNVTGSVPLSARAASKRRTDQATGELRSSEDSDDVTHESTIRALEILVSEIDNNPFQPRRKFNETEIASLAESIREHKQLQPILVRSVGNRFQLISGERRLRATIHAGLTTIRAEVREADDRLVAELAIVENLQRKDLDAIEKALSFRRYIDEHQCKQEDLAKRLKIDRSTIANLMRLLELPDELQNWVQNEKITAGHARTLLPLGSDAQQLEFARRIIEEHWTVRETERRVATHLLEEDGKNPEAKANQTGPRKGPRKRDTPHLASLEQHMRLSLGTKTEIRQQNSGRGKIVISFANAEEFERLYALICPQALQRAA